MITFDKLVTFSYTDWKLKFALFPTKVNGKWIFWKDYEERLRISPRDLLDYKTFRREVLDRRF